MNYLEYFSEREEKGKYWTAHAQKTLADPRATIYECKTAAIGVSGFNKKLEEQLIKKGGRKLKY
tara:strand:+ start:9097 stop:9288 length:192 start_codon:yes stop_codon:yes gene_type:complete